MRITRGIHTEYYIILVLTELSDVVCRADSFENEGELPAHYVSAPLTSHTLQQTVPAQKSGEKLNTGV